MLKRRFFETTRNIKNGKDYYTEVSKETYDKYTNKEYKTQIFERDIRGRFEDSVWIFLADKDEFDVGNSLGPAYYFAIIETYPPIFCECSNPFLRHVKIYEKDIPILQKNDGFIFKFIGGPYYGPTRK